MKQHEHPHRHHHHSHHHFHIDEMRGSKRLLLALVLNFTFACIEAGGGWWFASYAVLANALHDFGDSLSLLLALYLQRRSERSKPDAAFTYGYQRWSLLSAWMTSLVLIGGSVIIFIHAISRFDLTMSNLQSSASHPPQPLGMLLLAVIGLVFNAWAAWSTGHGKTQNEKAVTLHLLEDVLSWSAVLIGAFVMHLTGWVAIDQFLAIFISLFIIWNAIQNVRQTLRIFLQGSPVEVNLQNLKIQLRSIPGIHDIHDLHMWSLDGEKHVLSVHIVHQATLGSDQVRCLKMEARKLLLQFLGASVHATIETEVQGEDACQINCDQF